MTHKFYKKMKLEVTVKVDDLCEMMVLNQREFASLIHIVRVENGSINASTSTLSEIGQAAH